MRQRYLTRCCFALLLVLSVMANNGNMLGISGRPDVATTWGFVSRLSSP